MKKMWRNETKDKGIEGINAVVIEARKGFFNREILDTRADFMRLGCNRHARSVLFLVSSVPERSISAFLSNLVGRQREHNDRGSINIRESPETHL